MVKLLPFNFIIIIIILTTLNIQKNKKTNDDIRETVKVYQLIA